MRNFKTFGDNFSLDPVSTGSGGGCITACFSEIYAGPSEGDIVQTQLWRCRTSMNLIRLEARASYWYGVNDNTRFFVYNPNSDNVLASVYIDDSFDHAVWTGSVAVEAGDFLRFSMDGLPSFGEFTMHKSSVSAWFDGPAGGGLTFYVQSLE